MNFGYGNRSGNGLVYAGFNQNHGCFACCTGTGIRIYNCEPLKQKLKYEFGSGGTLGCVEMLFRCNYLALVGGGPQPLYPPHELIIWDDLRKIPTITLELNAPILAVKLRRDRIVVVCKGVIKVYTFTLSPQQIHVFETSANPKGLCVLSPASSNSLLAFPSRRMGHVDIIHLSDFEKPPVEIKAHNSHIACIALNMQGTRLATASEQGTVVRIFDTAKGGEPLILLRRGTGQANIYCMNFSSDSACLCLSSDHGTVHIFSVNDEEKQQSLVSSLMPKMFSVSGKSSTCRISIAGSPQCICAFGIENNTLIVVCADGTFYKYIFNLATGDSVLESTAQFLELIGDDS